MLFGPKPRDLRELQFHFDNLMTQAKYQKAARLTMSYRNQIKKNTSLDNDGANTEYAISYFLASQAADKQIRQNPKNQSFEFYQAFFALYIMGRRYFQNVLHDWDKGWNKEHHLYEQFKEHDKLYDDLYKDFDKDENLRKADLAVNKGLKG